MYALGIDVGGTKTLAVMVDRDLNVVARLEERTMITSDPEKTARQVAQLALTLNDETGIIPEGIGVAFAGSVDRDGKVVRQVSNFPWSLPVAFSDLVERWSDVPVRRLENDVNAALLAEWALGCHQDVQDMVMFSLGTGTGGGIMSSGRLLRGDAGYGGELGHIRVESQSDARVCGCGRRGCLEAYASGRALGEAGRSVAATDRGRTIRELAGGSAEGVVAGTVFQASEHGDPVGKELVFDFSRYLAQGLAILASTVNPALFVLGGGLTKYSDVFLCDVVREFRRQMKDGSAEDVPVRLSAVGPDAAALGAAMLVFPTTQRV